MLDESSNDREPPERISYESGCLASEECSSNKIEDYSNHYDDQYWLEMFYRALKENDQCIQRWLQQKFSAIIFNWIPNHPKGNLACHLHSKEYYVIETFRSFWSTLREQQKFELESMADVLSHLHVSMNGVILDTLRNYSFPQEAPFVSTGISKEVQSNENDHSHDIWRLIENHLSTAREQKMAYLLFHCALKPKEIVDSFPDEFKDVNEISRIRRNIMELPIRGDQISFIKKIL